MSEETPETKTPQAQSNVPDAPPSGSSKTGDEDLLPDQDRFSLPAVMSFDDRPSLLFESWGDGREAASRVMQNVMLRLLTSLPPSKVRSTIIDPVGLGQNFSAFMHLADFDEKLVTHRIWTESSHITKRLSDLERISTRGDIVRSDATPAPEDTP